jgi:ESX secretion-associated protein EspG
MTAVLSDPLTVTDDELRALAGRVGVQDFPIVLGLKSRHTTIDRRDAALDRASWQLESRKLIVNGAVHPEVESMLQVLHRPDRELAVRLITPEGPARISVVRRGRLGVLARRIGDDITMRIIRHSTELRPMLSALLAELPKARPADIQPVGAPLPDMAESLCGTHDSAVLADRIRALGAEAHAALLLGTALASRQAFAEIVYYTLADEHSRIARGPAAVAVFYTKRGRIIAAPSVSPAGQMWTTLKTGSDHVLAQAINHLIELSTQKWGEA